MDDSKEINVYHSQLLHIDNTEIKSIVNAFSPIFCVREGERNIKYKMTHTESNPCEVSISVAEMLIYGKISPNVFLLNVNAACEYSCRIPPD